MKNLLVLSLWILLGAGCSYEGKVVPMDDWSDAASDKKADLINGKLLVSEGQRFLYDGPCSSDGFGNFEWNAKVLTTEGSYATMAFHTDKSGKGYEVVLHNGPIDGTKKTGSLDAVRNLYSTLVEDGHILSAGHASIGNDLISASIKGIATDDEWFPVQISVKGKNISVKVNGIEVVNYTEPENPYRSVEYANRLLGNGTFALAASKGRVVFDSITVTPLGADAVNPDALAAIDEQNDDIIKLQQANFPVIDYHVHLKGWNKEQAHRNSMQVGINYGIAPNCGIGFPITDDAGVYAYRDSTKMMPFLFAMQGEGREWVTTFSKEARNHFDYVFTDAMTFMDHKNRRTRLWMDDEVKIDIPEEKYMDLIVDKIVKVLNEEPIDVYVNPAFVPTQMLPHYDALWTAPRIQKVVDALKKNQIALEINAVYKIPNMAFIKAAKDAGIKFAFGTNNMNPNIGKLEYCVQAIKECGLTPADIWFPSMKKDH